MKHLLVRDIFNSAGEDEDTSDDPEFFLINLDQEEIGNLEAVSKMASEDNPNFQKVKIKHIAIGWFGDFITYDELVRLKLPLDGSFFEIVDIPFRVIIREPVEVSGWTAKVFPDGDVFFEAYSSNNDHIFQTGAISIDWLKEMFKEE